MTVVYNDILESLQRAVVIFLVYVIFRAIYVCAKKRTFNLKYELFYAMFAVYAVEIACRLLFPGCRYPIMSVIMPPEPSEWRDIEYFNIIPFKTIYLYTFGTDNYLAEEWYSFKLNFWVGKLLLSVPLGIFIRQLFKIKNHKITLKKFAAIAVVIFTAVEIIQYPIGRVSDIDDVIINTLGCLLGYWLYSLYEKHRSGKKTLAVKACEMT
ncbi:MAG: VanZ family protein [Ruminococcus sp.]|nr:VanZ family protein [Ruminococcus sp.]